MLFSSLFISTTFGDLSCEEKFENARHICEAECVEIRSECFQTNPDQSFCRHQFENLLKNCPCNENCVIGCEGKCVKLSSTLYKCAFCRLCPHIGYDVCNTFMIRIARTLIGVRTGAFLPLLRTPPCHHRKLHLRAKKDLATWDEKWKVPDHPFPSLSVSHSDFRPKVL